MSHNIKLIEFYTLPLKPCLDSGDEEDNFYLPNYFINNLSLTIYDSTLISINDEVYFDIEESYVDIEKYLEGKVPDEFLIRGEKATGSILLGLIYSCLYGEQDEVINDAYGEDALKLASTDDNITIEAAGMQGIRMWSLDIDDIEITVDLDQQNAIEINTEDAEYDDIQDYFLYEEDDVQKAVLVI